MSWSPFLKSSHPISAFLDQVAAGTLIIRITPEDEQRAQQILRTYDDHRVAYTDATSFALTERLGMTHAFAFDGNFTEYRFIVLQAT